MIDFPAPDNKTWDDAVAYVRKFVKQWKGDRLITPALAPHAPFTVSREHLIQVRKLATELGAPILIHVSETKDELRQVAQRANGMTPGVYLDSIGFLGHDVVAAHGVWLTPDEIQMFAARKVGVVHCPESNMMLASGVAPIIQMQRAGVDIGLGTDGPAGSNNNLDMVEEMASAARLQKVIRSDPKALTAREVLGFATIGGARALNMADKIGSLETGQTRRHRHHRSAAAEDPAGLRRRVGDRLRRVGKLGRHDDLRRQDPDARPESADRRRARGDREGEGVSDAGDEELWPRC